MFSYSARRNYTVQTFQKRIRLGNFQTFWQKPPNASEKDNCFLQNQLDSPMYQIVLFLNDTLHVSDGLSVHHQEFKTAHIATGMCQTDNAVCLLASRQHYLFDIVLFWNDALHVSDGLSVHHTEFKTVHTATGICQTHTAVCLLASRQQYVFDICFLLYVQSWTPDDGRKDRPKHVECHSKKKNTLIYWCIWLVFTTEIYYDAQPYGRQICFLQITEAANICKKKTNEAMRWREQTRR